MIKTAVAFFLIILLGSLISALLGGGFGCIIAWASPEFVQEISMFNTAEENIVGYAFSLGMIWGLFIGAAVTGFACLLSTLLKLIQIRLGYERA